MKKELRPKKNKKAKKANRNRVAWTLPNRPRAEDNEVEFCERAGLIWDEYRRRKERENTEGKGRIAPFATAEGFFKRQSYGLFYKFVDGADDKKMIKRIVTKFAYTPESPTFAENPYHWALIAMFTVEGVGGKEEITAAKKKIWRLGNEMLYAKRSSVKAEFLIGFLYQSACSKNISKLIEKGGVDPSVMLNPLLSR